jgi:hypothetical protein
MAKAVAWSDGVYAFQRLFQVPQSEAARPAATSPSATWPASNYAARIASYYGDDRMVARTLDGLFAIAKADGAVLNGTGYIAEVAAIFGIEPCFSASPPATSSGRGRPLRHPGIDRSLSLQEPGALPHARRRVHPDRLIGSLPPQAAALATSACRRSTCLAAHRIERA